MSNFGKAFAAARKAGLKEFDWNGGKYNTLYKEEVPGYVKPTQIPEVVIKPNRTPTPKRVELDNTAKPTEIPEVVVRPKRTPTPKQVVLDVPAKEAKPVEIPEVIIKPKGLVKSQQDSSMSSVLNRQSTDSAKYKNFVNQGQDILNRTDVGRLNDSKNYIVKAAADYVKQGKKPVVIDIGSALGAKNDNEAGATVKDLTNDQFLNRYSKVIGTDIESEFSRYPNRKYNFPTHKISSDFKPDIENIVNKYETVNSKQPVILRSANGIDIIMDKSQTSDHFKHIGSSLKHRDVTYIFNKHILHKPANSTEFKNIGEVNNRGYSHRGAEWKTNKDTWSYKMY
jgi:hypothetical protein